MHFVKRSVSNLIRPFKIGFRVTSLPLGKMVKYSFSTDKKNSEFQKLKEDSKAFYNQQVQRVYQLKEQGEWKTLIEDSTEPVVVDFFADWCEPCKKLTPFLQNQVAKDNNWRLVKVNIDNFPEITSQLQIKSVPTVLLIANKQFVDGFSGYPDQTTLTRFLNNLKNGLDQGFLDSTKKENDQMKALEGIRMALVEQKYRESQNLIKELLKGGDVIEGLQPIVYLMLAHSYVEQRKLSQYQQTVKTFKSLFQPLIESSEQKHEFIRQYLTDLEKLFEQKKEAPEESSQITHLKSLLQANPSDLQTKFNLASEYSKNSQQQQALILLLEIVKSNKNWQNKKANNLMLQIFKTLGTSDQLTVKYRKLYQRLLY